jgi:hypothetical protein
MVRQSARPQIQVQAFVELALLISRAVLFAVFDDGIAATR